MTQQFETQVDTASPWKQFQGQIVAGSFPLQEYLGGSDHSAVFLTYTNSPEPAKAAIKLVLDAPEKTKQQLSRWELAAHLSNPNLLRIFHTGRCQLGNTDMLYAVMEYADEDLSQIVPQRALTAEEVKQMLPPIVDALAYIHSKGLVHGHIKPSNILACGDHVKLSSETICETDETVATSDAHNAPESTTSVAGDIWSLGASIVEVLTQQLPRFAGGNQMRIQIPQSVRAPFSDIAHGCLQIEPRRRWKLAEITARLQPETAARLQPETTVKHEIAKQEAGKREVGKPEIPGVKHGSRSSLQNQTAIAPKHSIKKSNVGRTMGIGLLLIALVGGPIMLRHRLKAPQAPVPGSSETIPETTATEQLAPVEPAAKSEKSTPKESAPKSAINSTSTAAPSSTRPKDVSTPATETPTESGVLHEALPIVLDKARDSIRGTVRVNVKVAVDTSGNVQHAELNASGPSKYFANLALQSAQEFKFEPAASDGGALREWILRFEFTNTGTKVFSARSNP